MGTVIGGGTVTAVGTLDSGATTEQRLDAVEAAVKQLRADLKEETQALTTSVEAVKQGVQREAEERAAAIRAVLGIVSITTTGDYSVTDTCVSASPIAVNATCTITVSFAPTATGSRQGSVAIANSVTILPVAFVVTGTGLTP